ASPARASWSHHPSRAWLVANKTSPSVVQYVQEEFPMTAQGLSLRVLIPLLFVLTCAAGPMPAVRTISLTADGTTLKASYFAAAKPGPGVLLLHQCNQQRKMWDSLAEH